MYTYITTTIRRHNWFRWTISFDYLVVTLSNLILLFFPFWFFANALSVFILFLSSQWIWHKTRQWRRQPLSFFWLLLNLTFTTHTRTRQTLSWFLLFQRISFVLFCFHLFTIFLFAFLMACWRKEQRNFVLHVRYCRVSYIEKFEINFSRRIHKTLQCFTNVNIFLVVL